MKRRTAVLFVLPIATVALVQPTARADVPAFAEGAPVSATSAEIESPNRPIGSVPQAITDRAEAVQQLVDASPDQFTGVQVGPSGITVAIPRGGDNQAAARKVTALADVPVRFVVVSRSRAEMYSVKRQIERVLLDGAYGKDLVGAGIDPIRGVAVAYTTRDARQVRSALKSRFADGVVFRELDGMVGTEADRSRDTSPHYGGAGYRQWNAGHTAYAGYCSTAFPISLSGTTYQLTAGHCLPGASAYQYGWADAFTSTTRPSYSYYFGGMSTTTVGGTLSSPTTGTSNQYGDWALIGGSNYSARVYNCENTTGSCGSLPVGVASWTTPSVGAGVCISGRTTGQTCRLFVVDPDCLCVVDGRPTAHAAIVRSDQNLDGVWDCSQSEYGDSGGAVYQGIGERPGYLRALGTITAKSGSDCSTSVYTKLSGLRAWNSSVSMPVY